MASHKKLLALTLVFGLAFGIMMTSVEKAKTVRPLLKQNRRQAEIEMRLEANTENSNEKEPSKIEMEKTEKVEDSDTRDESTETVNVDGPLPRVCGSPAQDAYASVNSTCLENSPTAILWHSQHPDGGRSADASIACNVEYSVSIDGLAVGWGIGNKKESPDQCCKACRDHVPGPEVGGPFGNLPCNAWVYCPDDICFEADAHNHTKGDCWLKFTEAPQSPEINARGNFPPEFLTRHPEAPEKTQWISGVLLPVGQLLTNGTWGPRASW